MTKAKPLVELKIARARIGCSECRQTIEPGDQMVLYDDLAVNWPHKPIHTLRHYCKDCGTLLEDSLTTTGDMA